jgi:hypothetical protein
MTDPRTAAIQYIHENQPRFLDELKEFVTSHLSPPIPNERLMCSVQLSG